MRLYSRGPDHNVASGKKEAKEGADMAACKLEEVIFKIKVERWKCSR